MTRVARRGNVRAIRPGLPIPSQREQDGEHISRARMAAHLRERAYQLAQTEPNSETHRLVERMAGMDDSLPRNNLRLLVTPTTPRAEWLNDAMHRVRIARAALELVTSRRSHALYLDTWDRAGRANPLKPEMDEAQAALNLAILDALRTPAIKRDDVTRKQEMIGQRAWAAEYRPEWQAIVDAELARFPVKVRKAKEARA